MKGIDFDVISKLEGGQQLSGYIPVKDGKVIGQSGVTIATGVDLGQWSLTDFKKLELPEELIKKVEPFLGRKKESALDAIAEQSLEITKEEADLLDKAIYKQIFLRVEELYNRDGFSTFEQLPAPAQTVIASVATNRGPAFGTLGGAWKTLWNYFLNGEWANAKRMLSTFPHDNTGLKARRKAEARILSALIEDEKQSV